MQRPVMLTLGWGSFPTSLACISISMAVQAATPQPSDKLTPSGFVNQYGNSMSLDQNTALISAYQSSHGAPGGGSVYAYERDHAGNWNQSSVLTNGGTGGQFGWSVSLKGDLAIVGARLADVSGLDSGAATIHREDVDGLWAMQATLIGSDVDAKDQFGFSVGIKPGVAVVGSPFQGLENRGAAYVFEESTSGSWHQAAKLMPSDSIARATFGVSVSVSDETILVGASGSGSAVSGSSYLFRPTPSGQWQEFQKLFPSDAVAGNAFGISSAIRGDTAIVGATGAHESGRVPGAAYIFRDDGAGNWSQTAKLTVSDSFGGSLFGVSVALFDGYAVVGSPGHDDIGSGGGTDTGMAYVFKEDASGVWSLEFALAAPDGMAGDGFGRSVAMSGSTVAVGAQFDDEQFSAQGSAYIFQIPEPSGLLLGLISAFALPWHRFRASRHRDLQIHTIRPVDEC